ncbi:MAG: hypothetical protein EGP82_10745 [Odoribacter splanchnicus]|nr:hypothetical protein [Odoribacter splanchnicus]
MKIKAYILFLIKKGHYWQYTNILGEGKRPKFFFNSAQWSIIVISFLFVYSLPKGLNNEFIDYTITAFSIFVGLFLALILSVYDKFQKINFAIRYNVLEKTDLIKIKNFFKQFTALTTYSILISILSIILLLLMTLYDFFKLDISQYSWTFISKDSLICFLKLFLLCLVRGFACYFILDFMLLALYAISSMFGFINKEYDKVKIKELFENKSNNTSQVNKKIAQILDQQVELLAQQKELIELLRKEKLDEKELKK